MESQRFDALGRVLAGSPSRRRALLALAGGALGLLGGVGAEQASAHNALKACRRKKTPKARAKCKKQARKHNARHRAPKDRCAGVVCGTAPRATLGCKDGACVVMSCDVGFDNCDGDAKTGCETNLQSDIKNCGRCGLVCPTGGGTTRCEAGKCVTVEHFATPGGPYRFTVELDGTLEIEATGGQGGQGGRGEDSAAGNAGGPGGPGAPGARVKTTISVTAGDQFDVIVGGGGGNGMHGAAGGAGGPAGSGGTAGQPGQNPSDGTRGGGGGGGGGTSEVRRVAGNVRVAAASGGSGGGGGGGGGGVPLVGTRGGNGGMGGISTGGLGGPGGNSGPGGNVGQNGHPGGQGNFGGGFPGGAQVPPAGTPNGFVTLTFRST